MIIFVHTESGYIMYHINLLIYIYIYIHTCNLNKYTSIHYTPPFNNSFFLSYLISKTHVDMAMPMRITYSVLTWLINSWIIQYVVNSSYNIHKLFTEYRRLVPVVPTSTIHWSLIRIYLFAIICSENYVLNKKCYLF